MSIKLVCINVERSKHIDRVLSFVKAEQPDVLCMQELVERDIAVYQEALGASHVFTPTSLHPAEIELAIEGVAIFSRAPIAKSSAQYYRGSADRLTPVQLSETRDLTRANEDMNYAILSGVIEKDGVAYTVCTTHFTWTPNAKPNEAQRLDLDNMLGILDGIGEFVLCGDFNAPRGGETFTRIAARYKDNIPPHYSWSIDGALHRAGHARLQESAHAAGLPGLMVDGLFTTATYRASDVRLVPGVSDHMAIVAMIDRVE